MANRLAPDDVKAGQANWADIDDDDEDWAPDAITWKDGTKITIPHTDEHAPVPAPAPAPVPEPAPVVTAPAPRLATKENGILEKAKTPPATVPAIIKPGVLGSGKGLVLKGAPEKPTLVAKPPAPPTPVKSPWAPIPKVDKVSPVVVEPQSHAAAKIAPREPTIARSNTPPLLKEIAADDFSRALWREGASGAGRELFNSQSGRYDPVPDRRGPLRPEPQHGRQPALLQRSSNQEQQASAEPSGPYPPGRPGEQPAPYGRRRGSSNVSVGSGGYPHRQRSHDQSLPPPELLNARRESMAGRSDSPASPRNFSPSGMQSGPRHAQGWPPRVSPAMSHATPHQQETLAAEGQTMPSPGQQPSAPAVTEDAVEIQRRVMRERRELALKRRVEQEQKEEAEKRERIRLKLEALGPAPESNSAKRATAKEQAVTPTQIQPRETLPPLQAAPAGEKKAADTASPRPGTVEPKKDDTMSNGIDSQVAASTDSGEGQSQPQGSSPAQPWPNSSKQPDRSLAASWGAQPAVAKNVWGAPNNNRSLGNGTFNADLVAAQVSQLPNISGPGPIAPPSGARPAQATAAAEPKTRLPPIGPPKSAAGGLSTQERESKQNAWASAVRTNDEVFRQVLNTQYEERDRQLQKEGHTLADFQPVIKETWRPVRIDESGRRSEAAPKQSLHLGPDKSWVTSAETKPTSSQQAHSGGSAAAAADYSQRAQSTAPSRDAAPSASILGPNNAAPQTSRSSRFFPAQRDRRESNSDGTQRLKSPSPPPPDMAGHPAFDGDVAHPHVSLPRPPVVVRLPPTMSAGSQSDTPETTTVPLGPSSQQQGPSFAWASQPAYKEHETAPASTSSHHAQRSGSDWQAKFDNLLGGRKTHPTPRSPVVDSASHSAHETFGHASSSHPRHAPLNFGKDGSMTTKVRDEECFEEQEMGSLPPVRLPNEVPEMAWQPSPAPKPLPKKLLTTASSAEAITFPIDMSGSGTVWRVAFPGFAKNIVVPFGRSRSNPRRGGGQRSGRHAPPMPHGRGGKGRDGPASYSNDSGTSPSNSNTPPGRNSRGGYRGGRDNWARPTPIQT